MSPINYNNNHHNLPVPYSGGEQPVSRIEAKLDTLIQVLAGSDRSGSPNPAGQPDGLSIYWYMLLRRKWSIALMVLIGALAGFAISFKQAPVYQAHTNIELLDSRGAFLNTKNFCMPNEGPSQSPEVHLQTQINILQSQLLLDRVANRLKKADPPVRDLFASVTADAFAKDLKVQQARGTRLIELTYDASDAEGAAAFLNTLTEEYIQQDLELRLRDMENTRDWLARELEGVKGKLERSEGALQQYAKNSGLMFNASQNPVAEEKLQKIEDELLKAHNERLTAQSQLEVATARPAESLPEVLDYAPIREYQVRLMDLRKERAALASTLTPAHYKVQRVDAQIKELEGSMASERDKILTRIRNEYDRARRREDMLQAGRDAQLNVANDKAGKAIHYNVLKREVDTNRNLYDALLQGMKEAGVNLALRPTGARVVDRATAPLLPYKPNRIVNSAVGLLLGLVFGVAIALGAETRNRTLREPDVSPMFLQLPELGVIPRITPPSRTPRSLVNRLRGEDPAGLTLAPGSPETALMPTAGSVRAAFVAESFRATLTSILFSKRDRPQVIEITSAGAGEGKSTVAGYLGMVLAEINQRALIIEADMRNPTVHRFFDVPRTVGLSTVLHETGPLSKSLSDYILRVDKVPGLYILPSGPETVSTANLLHSDRMKQLIAAARAEFDMVLIDTPPVLMFSDARIVGRLSDAVLLVIRAEQTTRDAAMAAARRLTDDGIPVLGTVLNDWNGRDVTSSYVHYSRYASEERG
jgi:succinoglycan biosynthesis transport protein ExoP